MSRYTLSLTVITLISQLAFGQNGTVVAFVNPDAMVDRAFLEENWPVIKEMASDYELDVKLIESEGGLPDEVRITPQLVFQNKYGRSFYVGRYSEYDRLKIFLRSVRSGAKQVAQNTKKDILVKTEGRSRITIPLKVTELTGSAPTGVDAEKLISAFTNSFNGGFDQFVKMDINFEPTDRAFYVDLHPYVSQDIQLYVSYEIYSQFNCVIPVITRMSEPVVTSLDNYEQSFKNLGNEIEQMILQYTRSATNGDGLSAVSNENSKSWEELGLRLEDVKTANRYVKIQKLNPSWSDPKALDAFTPLLQFNFQAPLDSYAGEATELEGRMNWKGNLLSGEFFIPTNSITMGEETYDENVHKKYIKIKKFPRATIVFNNQSVKPEELINEPSLIYQLEGILDFMGKSQKIKIRTSFEPFVDQSGQNKLIVFAQFETNIYETFKVKGPDGPQNAKENMSFQAQFIVSPNSK